MEYLEKCYKCTYCTHKCKTLTNYVRNYRLHRNVANAKFPCPLEKCIHSFTCYTSLSAHVLRNHSNRYKRHMAAAGMCGNQLNIVIECQHIDCRMVFSGLKEFIIHLKKHLQKNETIMCPLEHCKKNFTRTGSFTAHLSRKHRNYNTSKVAEQFIKNQSADHTGTQTCNSIDPTATCTQQIHVAGDNLASLNQEDDFNCDTDDFTGDLHENNKAELESQVLRSLALFYLKLQAKYLIPATTIQAIIEEFQNIHGIGLELMGCKLIKRFREENLSEEKCKDLVKEVISSDVFKICNSGPLHSDSTRKHFFKKTFGYVAPVEVTLGIEENQKRETYQYIPIKDSLKNLLENSSQYLTLDSCIDDEQDMNVLDDVSSGQVFKENTLFRTEKSLKLILYQDAFEVVNPLGSAKTKHKLLGPGVYFTLANFPPHLRSNIDHLQLVLLCKERHLKKFSQEKVFQKLIQDLKALETEGIGVKHEPPVRAAVTCISGDNLGSHAIGGFLESFSARYFCRYCQITNIEFANGDPSALGIKRNAENFNQHVQNLGIEETHTCGIKSDSCFNELKYFHVCNPGLPPCLGHDLFEGVVSYDMALMIRYFVKDQKWFTYDQLNRRLTVYKFEGSDSKDKPCAVDSKKDKLSGHAVQNWVFLRIFSLLMGKYILDTNNEVWELYLRLKCIVELICAPKISTIQIVELKNLIEEYLLGRKEIFSDVPLRPKHHYMAHYPDMILTFGPLIRVWTMRFESKHSYFKRCARNLQNFKHIEKTLAERHQLFQAYLAAGSFFPAEIIPKKGLPYQGNVYMDKIRQAVIGLDFNFDNTVVCYTLNYRGTEYKKDMYILLKEDKASAGNLLAGKIIFILNKYNLIYFLVNLYRLESYESVGLYKISSSLDSIIKCVNYSDILDYQPLPAYSENGHLYLSLKHSICSLFCV